MGGMARYEHDDYQRATSDPKIAGNPWFICTLWLAQWQIRKATSQDDLAEAEKLLEWVASRALPSGVLAEQVHPLDGTPLSVSPLTWSHATFVQVVLDYLGKRASFDRCPTCGQPLATRDRATFLTDRLRAARLAAVPHRHAAP